MTDDITAATAAPPADHQPTTTTDVDAVTVVGPRDSDGDYAASGVDEAVVLAQAVLAQGGHVAREFETWVQAEGYARSLGWIVYADEARVDETVAAIEDVLAEAGDLRVRVEGKPPAALAEQVLAAEAWDGLDRAVLVELLRELRWSGPDSGRDVSESEAYQTALGHVGAENLPDDVSSAIHTILETPGAAWGCVEIDVSLRQEASEPVFG